MKAQDPSREQLEFLVTLYNSGRYDMLVEEVERLLVSHPVSFRLWNIAGMTYRSLGEPMRAIEAFQKVRELKPEIASPLNSLGVVLQETGSLKEAISCFKKAVRLEPDNPGSHYNLGNAYRDQQSYDAALAAYRDAIRLSDTFAQAHNNMGNVLNDMGRLDNALGAYRRAVEAQPNYVDAYLNMAQALYRQGKPSEAQSICKQVLALKPDHLEAQNCLAKVLKATGQRDQAIQAYLQTALSDWEGASDDSKRSALRNLLMMPVGSLDTPTLHSLDELRRTLDWGTWSLSEVLFLEANFFMHMGRTEKAAETFDKANAAKLSELSSDGQQLEDWMDVWRAAISPIQEMSSTGACPFPVLLILGPSRSGKSTLEYLLSTNERIVPRYEAVDFEVLKEAELSGTSSLGASDKTQFIRRSLYLTETNDAEYSGKLIVCTNPSLIHYVPVLNALLDQLFIVFLERDAPGLAADIYATKYKNGNIYSYDFKSIMEYLEAYSGRMSLIENALSNRMIKVKYKDLLENPNAVIDRISSLTGTHLVPPDNFDPAPALQHLASRNDLAKHLNSNHKPPHNS